MSTIEQYNQELYHYGVKGMKWGVRKSVKPGYGKRMVRGHGGPGIYVSKKRQLAGDKRDLDYINKGGHLSVGVTKKRQAALDARDKRLIENRIAKNEKHFAERKNLDAAKAERREARKEYNKAYMKADTYNLLAYSPVAKHRKLNDRLWADAYDKAKTLNMANAKVKAEKKALKAAKKAEKTLAKEKMSDLMKQYGKLEDQYTYGKKADKTKNAKLDAEMSKLENEMKRYR